MSASESRQRSKLVGVRLLPEEHQALKIEAERQGVTLQALIRHLAGLTDDALQPV